MKEPFVQRRTLLRVGLYALACYLALVLLDNLIFLLSHLPPRFLPADGLIVALTRVEQALTAPRWLLRRLWPSETTPAALNSLLAVLNSLVWGAALCVLVAWWKKPRKPELQ
ncbi:MAG: hypothetical protein HY300_10480 [Verrucomicrobia bacterium]|nr:hypothetical protein [Verrucomicrobiota bacterium]